MAKPPRFFGARKRDPGKGGRNVGNPSHPGTGRFGNPSGDQPGYVQKRPQRRSSRPPKLREKPR